MKVLIVSAQKIRKFIHNDEIEQLAGRRVGNGKVRNLSSPFNMTASS